jgi:hypothetical protein
MEPMDLYNWYIKSGLLCGDLCTRTGSATKYREYQEFKKMQKSFTEKTLDKLCDPERVHVYAEVKILGRRSPNVVQSAHGDLHLVNMDNYFYSNDARKLSQYEKLKQSSAAQAKH